MSRAWFARFLHVSLMCGHLHDVSGGAGARGQTQRRTWRRWACRSCTWGRRRWPGRWILGRSTCLTCRERGEQGLSRERRRWGRLNGAIELIGPSGKGRGSQPRGVSQGRGHGWGADRAGRWSGRLAHPPLSVVSARAPHAHAAPRPGFSTSRRVQNSKKLKQARSGRSPLRHAQITPRHRTPRPTRPVAVERRPLLHQRPAWANPSPSSPPSSWQTSRSTPTVSPCFVVRPPPPPPSPRRHTVDKRELQQW
jgi:hypothetical protein